VGATYPVYIASGTEQIAIDVTVTAMLPSVRSNDLHVPTGLHFAALGLKLVSRGIPGQVVQIDIVRASTFYIGDGRSSPPAAGGTFPDAAQRIPSGTISLAGAQVVQGWIVYAVPDTDHPFAFTIAMPAGDTMSWSLLPTSPPSP
jgi:hypothetical protein